MTTVAAHQLARRAWKLALLGLAAGLVGAVVIGALATARRTATAYDRLADASGLDDVRAMVVGEQALAEEVTRLPGVTGSWVGTIGVGRIEGRGGLAYATVLAGPESRPGTPTPVIVTGRAPVAADEVAVVESVAAELGLEVGDTLTLRFLTPDEMASFDTGFGDPDGPTLDLPVVGLVRSAGRVSAAPVLASPAFAERHGPDVDVGHSVHLSVVPGTDVADVQAGVDALLADVPPVPGAEEFVPVQLEEPDAERSGVSATARVLVVGQLVLAGLVAVAGVVAVGQAFGRHYAARAGEQRVEAALGVTARERLVARLIAATPAIAVATAVTAVGALVAGTVEPLGAIGRVEPHPGWAPNVVVIALGTAVVALTMAGLVALAAWRAGRRPRHRMRDNGRAATIAGRVAQPVGRAGVGLAIVPGGDPAPVPVRSTIAGVVLGVAGVVAVATFAASLDRLVDSPVRWGWSADLMVVDASEPIVDELVDHPAVSDLTVVESTQVRIGDELVDAQALTTEGGAPISWTLLEGQLPTTDGEVVLGSRLAQRLDVGPGGAVAIGDDAAVVVGVGLGPSVNGEPLGSNVLVTPGRLAVAGESSPFREALVRLAPGVNSDAAASELGARYELTMRTPPVEVANVGELGRLPATLAALLGVLALAGLVHALASTVRRRSRELAVLRAIGFTPRQVAGAVTVTALTTVLIGLVVGVPIGLGVGQAGWRAVARATGVAGDAAVPAAVLVAVIVGAPLLGAIAALVPARRAARLRPAALLTSE